MLFKSKNKEEKDPSIHPYTVPLAQKTNDLLKEGFTDQFVLSAGGLKSSQTGKIYRPEDLRILKHYRFEGTSDPGDMTILYAIESPDGTKGTVVDGYGTYSDADLGDFMKNVEEAINENNPGANQSSEVEERLRQK